jgi:CHAT domain-containing protein
VAGEGVFALSRGFHAAGVARVIASLWPVNDASTAQLIGTMFREAATGDSARPPDWTRLLRDAKRAVRAQAATSEPFYWSPFVLSGAR